MGKIRKFHMHTLADDVAMLLDIGRGFDAEAIADRCGRSKASVTGRIHVLNLGGIRAIRRRLRAGETPEAILEDSTIYRRKKAIADATKENAPLLLQVKKKKPSSNNPTDSALFGELIKIATVALPRVLANKPTATSQEVSDFCLEIALSILTNAEGLINPIKAAA